MRTRRRVDLSRVYGYRIKTIEALLSAIEGKPEIELFETAIRLLDSAASNLGDKRTQVRYADFTELLRGLLLLVLWGGAIRKAEMDADRYLRAARQAAKDLLDKPQTTNGADAIMSAAQRLSEVADIADVTNLARLLLTIPLPIPVFSEPPSRRGEFERNNERPAKPSVTVAFLSFALYEGP
jgi:CRP-like cAMP-binding protein